MKKVSAFILCLITVISCLPLTASAYSAVLIREPDRTSFYGGKDWVFDNGNVVALTDFDVSGAVVEVDGERVEYETHSWGGNMWIAPKSGSWSVGVNKAVIYLDDYDDEAYVDITINLVTIKKIETVSPPDSSTLVMGVNWHYDRFGFINLDSLDLTGAAIRVYYSDSTDKIIEHSSKNPLEWQVPFDTDDFVLGENTLEFNYENHSSPFTVTFVEELITAVYIKTPPKKTVYAFGDDWNYDENGKVSLHGIDFSGMSVTANCLGAGNKVVTYESCPEKFTYDESRTFRTGTTRLEVTYDGKFTFGYVLVVEAYGDINLNGSIDSADALLILQCITARKQFEDNQKKYADVDLNGKVNSSDALYVLQRATGQILRFKAELQGG